MSDAYFCLVTWPDGTEGLLFPRPGNVPINTTKEEGERDFIIAHDHLIEHIERHPRFKDTKIRLVRFERKEVVNEFPKPADVTVVADLSKVEERTLKLGLPPKPWPEDMHTCPKCGRQMSHTQKWGYICEYCAGIED